jgi:Fe2+ transport system protein FeoA
MGFCENTHITKTREGKNIVCSTCGIRLALNQKLAKDIIVDEL